MTLDTWLDGILDSRKGNVLVLHGLCLLIEWHAWVHLNDGKVWTSLCNLPKSHEATEVVLSTMDISLSANEIVTINMLMLAGLGVGLSQL